MAIIDDTSGIPHSTDAPLVGSEAYAIIARGSDVLHRLTARCGCPRPCGLHLRSGDDGRRRGGTGCRLA
jgi:uncharacterized Fe-S cluster-containing radical SAM superfamily enzyme